MVRDLGAKLPATPSLAPTDHFHLQDVPHKGMHLRTCLPIGDMGRAGSFWFELGVDVFKQVGLDLGCCCPGALRTGY